MRLIDLSDAVNVVEGYRDRNPDSWSLCNSIKFDIAELPTLSPDEVRGVGEWEDAKQHGLCRCSVCKDCYIEKNYITHVKWRFCPNCGARMKGEKDNASP